MSDTTDLVTWLSGVLDEDERVTRAVLIHEEEHWYSGDEGVYSEPHGGQVVGSSNGWFCEVGVHIAAHDPAAVLADIAAKRRILAIHNVWTAIYPEDAVYEWRHRDRRCIGCGFDSSEEPNAPDVNDCETLRALALAYADRPGYRAEWAP